MATSSESNREVWLARSARVARQVNTGWWWETLSAPLVLAATIGACGLLLTRREAPGLPVWQLACILGGALLLIALACWLVARRKFETPDQSLVRIEASMRMRNALSAAKAGVAPWPSADTAVDAGVRWHWPRVLVPVAGAIVLLLAGLFIPVSPATAAPPPHEEPQAWQKIESQLDQLAKDATVDKEYLEEMKKQVEELRAQKPEDWFSHASLEATDSLKRSHQSEMQRMGEELARTQRSLEGLKKETAGGAEQAKLANEFQQALQGLQNGAMKPNPQLLDKLQKLDPKNLGQLSPEQMQQLQEGLKQAAEGMKDAQGQGEGQGQGDDWADELLSGEGKGQGQGQGQGEGNGEGEGEGEGDGNGEGAGKGGVGRGPGHSPGVLGKEHQKLETGSAEALKAKDLSRARPGDLLELQEGEHEVDKSATRVIQGGATDSTGQGGDRVWKESLDPSEQRAMKKFFE